MSDSDLERRVRALEDEAAVRRVVADYGPLVDSGRAEEVAALWVDDGAYDYQADAPPLAGRDGLAAMVRSRPHQAYLEQGCGHVLGPVTVRVDGDRAVATGYSLLVRRAVDADGWRVARLSANRWELVRTPTGWRVARRVNRLLDGGAEPRDLLAALDEPAPRPDDVAEER